MRNGPVLWMRLGRLVVLAGVLVAGLRATIVHAVPPYPPSLELGASLSAADTAFYVSRTMELIVSFHNRLQESVRVLTLIARVDVRLRDAAGNLYVEGPGGVGLGGGWDEVLQPNELRTFSWPVSHVVRADENGTPLEDAENLPLSPGDYQVEVRCHQHEADWLPVPGQPERLAYGVAISNTIIVTMLDDAQPMPVASARLRTGPRELARVFRHRGVEMVRAEGLRPYSVNAMAGKGRLVLRRGGKRVTLPCERLRRPRGKAARLGPPLPAVTRPSGGGHYVPLRYVATKLGLEVRYDARRRVYDLRPRTRV